MQAIPIDRGLVLYDGECRFCQGWLRFILDRDRQKLFRFAPLQGETARRMLGETPPLDSVIYIELGKTYRKSAAAIAILRRLGFPWNLAFFGLLIPPSLRDKIYDRIAGKRHRLSTTKDCRPLTKEEGSRLLP